MTRYICIEPFNFHSTDEHNCIIKVSVGEEIDLKIAYDDCIGGTRYFVYVDDSYIGDVFTEHLKHLKPKREVNIDKLL